jgi:hypothetical protein
MIQRQQPVQRFASGGCGNGVAHTLFSRTKEVIKRQVFLAVGAGQTAVGHSAAGNRQSFVMVLRQRLPATCACDNESATLSDQSKPSFAGSIAARWARRSAEPGG